MTRRGKIKFFKNNGIGFVTDDETGRDVFLHHTILFDNGIDQYRVLRHMRVMFEAEQVPGERNERVIKIALEKK